MDERRIAVVTGASAGIGAATAEALARSGFEVVLGARRVDRIEALARRLDGRAYALDVTDGASITRFAERVPDIDVLVNNAGVGLGLDPVADLQPDDVRRMWETNVLGLIEVTRTFLPTLENGGGHIVNVTSTAAIETYPGGGGYTSTKHAARALTRTLRLELLGKPIRVTEIAPGMVETEFSIVRFGGDDARAAQVYEGLTPLRSEDIADAIVWVVTRPPHVNIDEVVVRPVDQATSTKVHRRPSGEPQVRP